jgi:hypothetical protein
MDKAIELKALLNELIDKLGDWMSKFLNLSL